jgi:hypothetical protein
MLQLHKMHSRHGAPGSVVLWKTHLQRLQIQLQTSRSNILHAIHRNVSCSIRTLLSHRRFHSYQSGCFCDSFSLYNLQRLNVANKKTLKPAKVKSPTPPRTSNRPFQVLNIRRKKATARTNMNTHQKTQTTSQKTTKNPRSRSAKQPHTTTTKNKKSSPGEIQTFGSNFFLILSI